MAFLRPSVPSFVLFSRLKTSSSDWRSFSSSSLNSCKLSVNKRCDLFAENKSRPQEIISFPYMESMVMATTNAVCHEMIDDASCFHTGVAACPSALRSAYCWRARFTSSIRIGMLFDMARKKVFTPMVSEGSSLATCWTDMLRLLNVVPPALRRPARRLSAWPISLSRFWIFVSS